MSTAQRRRSRNGLSREWILVRLLRSILLVFLFLLLGSASARADETPQIRATQKVIIDAVGDAHFTVDVKMPVALYTLLKDRTRNTALLLRQIGLSHQDSYEVQDGKGEFDDGSSTVHFSWTTRGLARPVHEDLWEAPVDETSGLELLYLHENVALFNTAASSPFGVMPLVVHAEVAPGSRDLRLLHSPSRLAYRAPVASFSRGGRPSFDFEFQAKPQVMTCLAKSYGNPKFTQLWVARTVLKNTGDQAVTDYRARFRLRDSAPSWSAWKQCARVVPGQTVVDAYFPIFDLEKVGRLSGSCRDELELEYQYRRPDGQLVEMSDSRTIQLLGRNEVVFSSRKAMDCGSWQDRFDYGPAILASFVTKDDPIVQQVAGWVSGQAGGVAANATDEKAITFLQALYQFMAANAIAYQTPPSGEFNGQFGQHIKYGRDVLQNRAGTCVDLAIFYGSVCEAVGLEPVLFLIPGHCFPSVRLPRSGKLWAVETTGVGRASFKQVSERGLQEVQEARQKGLLYEVDIVKLHNKGIYGLQLPALPPSTLTDWGIRPVTTSPVTTSPATTSSASNAASSNIIPSWVVGAWKCDNKLSNTHIQLVLTLGGDGMYQLALRHTNASGQFTAWAEERGTFRVGSGEFVFLAAGGKNKDVPVTRKHAWENGYLWISFPEIGYQLPFTRGGFDSLSSSNPSPPITATTQPASVPPQVYVPSGGGQRTGIPGRAHHGHRLRG
jgi:hypothetical protein